MLPNNEQAVESKSDLYLALSYIYRRLYCGILNQITTYTVGCRMVVISYFGTYLILTSFH